MLMKRLGTKMNDTEFQIARSTRAKKIKSVENEKIHDGPDIFIYSYATFDTHVAHYEVSHHHSANLREKYNI